MKNRLLISHNSDDLTAEDAIIISNDINDGFIYSAIDILIKESEFKHFINDVEEKYGTLSVYDYSQSKTNIFKRYKSDRMRIYTNGNSLEIFTSIYATTEDDLQDLWNLIIKYIKDENSTCLYFCTYYIGANGVADETKIIKEDSLNYISKSYYPYIDTDIMFEQFFTGDENILLVVGEPGLGKSKMSSLALKYAFSNTNKLPYDKLDENSTLDNQFISVAYAKSSEVISSDKFWRMIGSVKNDFVILDDLDYMLTKRNSEVMSSEDQIKNNFLNQFLSFTDGVEKNKTKFIITTNQDYDDIDTALLRKGRLFDIIELRKLSADEALKIWKENNLEEKEFKTIFTTHEILPADLGSEISKRHNKRIASATKSYLLEDGISKVKKAGRSKKIKM